MAERNGMERVAIHIEFSVKPTAGLQQRCYLKKLSTVMRFLYYS